MGYILQDSRNIWHGHTSIPRQCHFGFGSVGRAREAAPRAHKVELSTIDLSRKFVMVLLPRLRPPSLIEKAEGGRRPSSPLHLCSLRLLWQNHLQSPLQRRAFKETSADTNHNHQSRSPSVQSKWRPPFRLLPSSPWNQGSGDGWRLW